MEGCMYVYSFVKIPGDGRMYVCIQFCKDTRWWKDLSGGEFYAVLATFITPVKAWSSIGAILSPECKIKFKLCKTLKTAKTLEFALL